MRADDSGLNFGNVWVWLNDPANWHGSDGILAHVREQVFCSVVAVAISRHRPACTSRRSAIFEYCGGIGAIPDPGVFCRRRRERALTKRKGCGPGIYPQSAGSGGSTRLPA